VRRRRIGSLRDRWRGQSLSTMVEEPCDYGCEADDAGDGDGYCEGAHEWTTMIGRKLGRGRIS